ncbi:hypothetical protein DPEC_G00105600 [Dallia pectoralis]|uniref:Uncharacterized protein n=1 Tax=Dallia pectoralis TaxID=75939 RepID=A0ACC2GXW0_DALPE|nr:hypothetical protein DPEC_G00105600 [Dallia pectoralis]
MQQPARERSIATGCSPDRRPYSLCSDDQWESKCPSGCRLLGLIEERERQTEDRMRNICQRKLKYEDKSTTSMLTTKHIYYTNRKTIVQTYVSEVRYVELAERLAQNITLLRNRLNVLSQKLKEQQIHVKKQIQDIYRQEVDVDIKLRACQGSCKRTFAFHIDHRGYQLLQDQITIFDTTSSQKPPANDIPKIKLRPVKVGPPPSIGYKTIPIVQKELLTQFEDIEQNQVILEEVLEPTECPGSEMDTERK